MEEIHSTIYNIPLQISIWSNNYNLFQKSFLDLYFFRCNKIDHIVCFMCKLLFNKLCHAKLLACIEFTLA